MAEKVYGLDLGTGTIKIAQKRAGVVLQQKNMLAVAKKKEAIAIGDEAFEMYEKVPKNIEVRQPLHNGVIADFTGLQVMMQILYKGLHGEKICDSLVAGGSSEFYIAVPIDITEVEKRAFFELIATSSLRTRKIRLVEKPIAAAIGAGMDLASHGNMVVDIGADSTEITLIRHERIVKSTLLKLGGQRLDEQIQYEVKKKHNLIIGMRTAEKIKKEVGSATTDYADKKIPVMGRNLITGLPNRALVSGGIVYDAIRESVAYIIETVKNILEQLTPETAEAVEKNGIYLVGGCADLANLDTLLSEITGYPVHKEEEPDLCVAKGLGKIIEEPELERIALSGQDLYLR